MNAITLQASRTHVKNTGGVAILKVLAALLPATVAYVWFFGPGLLINIAIACVFCLLFEAAATHLRGARVDDALSDYTAILTAVLIAFALPPLTPWWITGTACLFAIVVAKHLYGGAGSNVFNPAMVGYVAVLVAFPQDTSLWLPPRIGDIDYDGLSLIQTLSYTITGNLPMPYDAVTRATPLDTIQSGLKQMRTVDEMRALPLMGDFGGRGWEWIGNFVALGGLWLMSQRIIRWHIPIAVMAGVLIPATIAFLVDPGTNAGPGFHLFSGATLLCAFFIATDPVSAAATPTGRLVYGFGIGVLIFTIRKWGSYADGVAFAVLLMNMAVPAIDALTRVDNADGRQVQV
ncbi:MAG: RnfABCDGE type electron transport complex subunit D [Pseudomonadota bacterium]